LLKNIKKLAIVSILALSTLSISVAAQAEQSNSDYTFKAKIIENGGYVGKYSTNGTTSYTVPTSTSFIAMTSSSAKAVILPNPTLVRGQEFTVFNASTFDGTNPVTVTCTGGANLGAAASQLIAGTEGWIKVKSNGTKYNIVSKFLVYPVTITRTLTAVNTTGTVTAIAIAQGGISSTSGAAVTATLPTASSLATALGGAVQGTSVEFEVDNTAGSNTVTVAVGSGIVVAKQTGFGLTANDQLLTVAASATVGVGVFRIVFSSATAAVLYRIG
jgi:hypothetical protein